MATKRANGEGSIRQRKDGTWEARITVGTNPGTEKPIRKSFYGKSQKEVRMKLQEAAKKVMEGDYCEPSKITVGQWLDIWLAEYLGSVKSGTASNYATHVRLHIKPALGAVKLSALKPPMIQKVYNELQKEGLSAKTIKNLHGCLHKALDAAEKVGYIVKNPSSACILPRVEEKEIKPLDEPEIKKLLQALQGHEHEALFKTALFTGLRSGEILCLTWYCVDFENGLLYIKNQITPTRQKGEQYSFGPLKNDKPRILAPAPFVMRVLSRRKIEQAEQRLRAGNGWNTACLSNLVFTDNVGRHLTQVGMWKVLQKVLASAGIEKHRFHDLRHPGMSPAVIKSKPAA